MVKFLVKNTAEYRFETFEDVEAFHKECLEKANKDNYQLNSFSWTEKTEKEKGEVVGIYYLVKVVSIFNELKEPTNPFYSVEFPKGNE